MLQSGDRVLLQLIVSDSILEKEEVRSGRRRFSGSPSSLRNLVRSLFLEDVFSLSHFNRPLSSRAHQDCKEARASDLTPPL